MKKVVCCWVPHNLTEHQKEEPIRISKETLKMINDGGHLIISKIIMGNETYIRCSNVFGVLTRQESKVWIFEEDATPTMVKRQCALKKEGSMPFSSEVRDWSKPSNWKNRRQ